MGASVPAVYQRGLTVAFDCRRPICATEKVSDLGESRRVSSGSGDRPIMGGCTRRRAAVYAPQVSADGEIILAAPASCRAITLCERPTGERVCDAIIRDR